MTKATAARDLSQTTTHNSCVTGSLYSCYTEYL